MLGVNVPSHAVEVPSGGLACVLTAYVQITNYVMDRMLCSRYVSVEHVKVKLTNNDGTISNNRPNSISINKL